MSTAYCSILIMTYLTLFVLAALIHANLRVSKQEKKRFYQICLLIMFAAFWEWLSLFLNGAASWTTDIHKLAKCMDYIFTPVCSVLFIRQVAPKGRGSRLIMVIMCLNALLELISIFTGWTFYVDSANVYHHGPLYIIYSIIWIFAILFVIYAFWEYGKKYARQNRGALFAIFFLIAVSVTLQTVWQKDGGRVAYLGMAIASCMLFIHYTEFHQIEQDAMVQQQDKLLATDALTGVLSRFAYMQVLADYSSAVRLPDWLAAFEIDLNGLKTVNDTLGHEAGDELLRGSGDVLQQVIGASGHVFRIGGDEFVVLLDTRLLSIDQSIQHLRSAAAEWKGPQTQTLSFSIGCATVPEFPNADLTQLLHEADQRMYADKDRYYSVHGNDRRRGPRGNDQQ